MKYVITATCPAEENESRRLRIISRNWQCISFPKSVSIPFTCKKNSRVNNNQTTRKKVIRVET
ncbi:hypothetical protein HanXRQr2_Chr01g0044261 [Helianthus annuus]|uniref:Uncharacterized protein n=1 Tax=Helianthus annuus TaxID=4232 RepID=A0A9K3K0F7_HELAN|nr:hypothetical protein HanXRQr2_Chr01g0044261 [Helianthus annuus]